MIYQMCFNSNKYVLCRWVILNVTFLLSAGFKWGHEAIEKYGTYFHCLAWSFPLAQTVAALFLAKVDGNELTGKINAYRLMQIYTAPSLPTPVGKFQRFQWT